MIEIVFLVEGMSEKKFLEAFLKPPIIKEEVHCRCIKFYGKADLIESIKQKIEGWLDPAQFVILCDKDSDNCIELKQKIKDECKKAGRENSLVRIACNELESWYFGDLESVGEALNLPKLSQHSHKANYRKPDEIIKPSKALERITNKSYQKVNSASKIAPLLAKNSASNTSKSFQVFLSGIKELNKKL